jgi:hypothetical protein
MDRAPHSAPDRRLTEEDDPVTLTATVMPICAPDADKKADHRHHQPRLRRVTERLRRR